MHLLVSEAMEPVPENITVLADWGRVDIHSEDKIPEMYYTGKHMMIKGSNNAIRSWLAPFKGVWLGKGSPIMQQFEIAHIK